MVISETWLSEPEVLTDRIPNLISPKCGMGFRQVLEELEEKNIESEPNLECTGSAEAKLGGRLPSPSSPSSSQKHMSEEVFQREMSLIQRARIHCASIDTTVFSGESSMRNFLDMWKCHQCNTTYLKATTPCCLSPSCHNHTQCRLCVNVNVRRN
jgi:hypothetical protein